MKILMWILPLAYVVGTLYFRIRKLYKEGLFVALLHLANTIVSAVAAFLLTRLLLDPAKIDLFGMGAAIHDLIPPEFFAAVPETEALVLALPTAFVALIGFTGLFNFLRWLVDKLLDTLTEKFGWEEKFGKLHGQHWLGLIPSAISSVLVLLVDMVLIGGCIHLGAHLMVPAKYAFEGNFVATAADATMALSESPVIELTDSLGCKWAFETLTTGQRDGKPFSAGKELIEWSRMFDGLGKATVLYGENGEAPDAETLRALADDLTADPHTVRMAAGLIHSNEQALAESDAIKVLSQVLGTTPERFGQYLSQVTPEQLEGDIHTACNIAAILAERNILPDEGQLIDMATLNDPALLEEVRQEAQKNPDFAAFFGLAG